MMNVDTYAQEAASIDGLQVECLGGLEFSIAPNVYYDRALIKEVVHHLPDDDLAAMYGGIFEQLR